MENYIFSASFTGVFSQGRSQIPNKVSFESLPDGNIIPILLSSKNFFNLIKVSFVAEWISFDHSTQLVPLHY
jgi:hypothetical protein